MISFTYLIEIYLEIRFGSKFAPVFHQNLENMDFGKRDMGTF